MPLSSTRDGQRRLRIARVRPAVWFFSLRSSSRALAAAAAAADAARPVALVAQTDAYVDELERQRVDAQLLVANAAHNDRSTHQRRVHDSAAYEIIITPPTVWHMASSHSRAPPTAATAAAARRMFGSSPVRPVRASAGGRRSAVDGRRAPHLGAVVAHELPANRRPTVGRSDDRATRRRRSIVDRFDTSDQRAPAVSGARRRATF